MRISDWSSDVCSSDLGYAGTSASALRAEIEAQRRLGQTDDLLDYFDRRQGGASLGGPAGPRIGRTLDDAAVQLGPLPAMIADRARLRVMLASVARTFHVGPLADCFFDPATALCLKRVPTDRKSTRQGKSVSVRSDLGGRRSLKKTKPTIQANSILLLT